MVVEVVVIVFGAAPEVGAEDEHAAAGPERGRDRSQHTQDLFPGSAVFEKIAHEGRVEMRPRDDFGKPFGGDFVDDDVRGGMEPGLGVQVHGNTLGGLDVIDEFAITRGDLENACSTGDIAGEPIGRGSCQTAERRASTSRGNRFR